jgi:hypothetical protein
MLDFRQSVFNPVWLVCMLQMIEPGAADLKLSVNRASALQLRSMGFPLKRAGQPGQRW